MNLGPEDEKLALQMRMKQGPGTTFGGLPRIARDDGLSLIITVSGRVLHV